MSRPYRGEIYLLDDGVFGELQDGVMGVVRLSAFGESILGMIARDDFPG